MVGYYQQKNFDGFFIQSVRLEENVSVVVNSEDYQTLKYAFESTEALKVEQHPLFQYILRDVKIGKRLKYCIDGEHDIKYYTYTAQLIEEVKISDIFSVYDVGLNLGQGKDHINMVIKICRNDMGISEYYEYIPSEYKSQVYEINIHISCTGRVGYNSIQNVINDIKFRYFRCNLNCEEFDIGKYFNWSGNYSGNNHPKWKVHRKLREIDYYTSYPEERVSKHFRRKRT